MKIACGRSTVRTSITIGRMREALYGNYLQWACDRPDDTASASRRGSQTGKILSKNLRISIAQLSFWTTYDHRLDGTHIYQSSHPFEPPAYK
jgi:hypothetical protein